MRVPLLWVYAFALAAGFLIARVQADEVQAQTGTIEVATTGQSTSGQPPVGLPSGFTKSVPESLEDLRSMQAHLQGLLPKLKLATVALRVGQAHGSGVIVSPEGIVMTAGHVSGRPGNSVQITLSDGQLVYGTSLGRNRQLDSGLIKIDQDRTDWPYCPRLPGATEAAPALGDWCIALGHPGGLQKGRTAPVRLGRIAMLGQRLLQTDCELVGGDSGGPLFNMRGEVIAINSRIGQPLEFNYHVPTAVYHKDWDQLARSENVEGHSGALLGLSGAAESKGLRVTKVYENEPASLAGVMVDDILVTIDAKRIGAMQELVDRVGEKMPGDVVTLELLRKGSRIEIEVELDMRWD